MNAYIKSVALVLAALVLMTMATLIFGMWGFIGSFVAVLIGMIAQNAVSSLVILLAYVVIGSQFSWSPIIINPTPSIPPGVFWNTYTREPAHRGLLVGFSQPHRPGLREVRPYGIEHLFKYVAALPGDTIEVTPTDIFVNGHRWPNSQPPNPPDLLDHRLLGRHIIPPGYVWVMGTNSDSFDSRFLGEIPATSILYTGSPHPIFGAPNNKLCNDTGTSPNPCFLRPDSVFSK